MVFGTLLEGEGSIVMEGLETTEEGMEAEREKEEEEEEEDLGGSAGGTGATGVILVPKWRSSEGESQEGGELGSSSTIVLGIREEGSALRCSMKVTWNELKMCLVKESQSQ